MSSSQPRKSSTLKDLLKERDLKSADFCEQVGVSHVTPGSWSRGSSIPRADHAIKAAKALGVSLKTFFRSIGLDVDEVPDDVPPVVDPGLQELLDTVAEAIKQVEAYKEKQRIP